jgi:hypothetical protein
MCVIFAFLPCSHHILVGTAACCVSKANKRIAQTSACTYGCRLMPDSLKPSDNYSYMSHLLQQSVILNFVFMGFV